MLSAMRIRLATIDDAAAIREIYNREVETSTVTFDLVPRSLRQQRDWISARSGAFAVVVAETEAESETETEAEGQPAVTAFGSLSPYRDRPAYTTSVEDSVYVHRDHQGRGVGKLVLGELLRVATAHGFHAVFARIVGGHQASIGLHRALGFEIVGTEREVGRKFGQWLDVVVMERLL
jgi:L-amino acid N-acyltransferase YncA